MIAFTVTARTEAGVFTYTAIAASSFDAANAAVDRFGPCAVTVRVKP